jgi:hypothetical protein
MNGEAERRTTPGDEKDGVAWAEIAARDGRITDLETSLHALRESIVGLAGGPGHESGDESETSDVVDVSHLSGLVSSLESQMSGERATRADLDGL